jgi:hypothetical protein
MRCGTVSYSMPFWRAIMAPVPDRSTFENLYSAIEEAVVNAVYHRHAQQQTPAPSHYREGTSSTQGKANGVGVSDAHRSGR